MVVDLGLPHELARAGVQRIGLGLDVAEEHQGPPADLAQHRRRAHPAVGLERPARAARLRIDRIDHAGVGAHIELAARQGGLGVDLRGRRQAERPLQLQPLQPRLVEPLAGPRLVAAVDHAIAPAVPVVGTGGRRLGRSARAGHGRGRARAARGHLAPAEVLGDAPLLVVRQALGHWGHRPAGQGAVDALGAELAQRVAVRRAGLRMVVAGGAGLVEGRVQRRLRLGGLGLSRDRDAEGDRGHKAGPNMHRQRHRAPSPMVILGNQARARRARREGAGFRGRPCLARKQISCKHAPSRRPPCCRVTSGCSLVRPVLGRSA